MELSPLLTTWILAQEGPPPANPLGMFVPIILMFVILYFLMIRPQRKKQQELARQIDAMKIGDFVVTIGGLHGMVANKKGDVVTIKAADNVKLRFDKSAIGKVIPKASLSDEDDDEPEETVDEKLEGKE